ncbi:MAG: DUF11 domain-containing protein, partial [Propionibacteriaceae bacterium]|nr:DUF11 domain-containing protein [Propionibacteriaceae bacterium]
MPHRQSWSRLSAVAIAVSLVSGLGFIVTASSSNGAIQPETTPFAARYSVDTNGGVVTVSGNSLLCDVTDPTCQMTVRYGLPFDNDDFVMTQYDEDDDSSTFNSSRSSLDLPNGATVLWAGLYWGGRLEAGQGGQDADEFGGSRTSVLFQAPDADDYQTVVSDTAFGPMTGPMDFSAYQSFADVTEIVQESGSGDYMVANVAAATGYDRYGGWTLTVVYQSTLMPHRHLAVFDGFNSVRPGHPQTLTADAFQTPSDNTVATDLTLVAYDGDRGQSGDSATLNTTQVATTAAPGANFFNASADASQVTAAQASAAPNLLGFDHKTVDATSALPHDSRSANLTWSTQGDIYYPGLATLAVNTVAPDFTDSIATAVDLTNNYWPEPGNTMQYSLTYINTGFAAAQQATSCQVLPAEVTYVPDSLVLTSTPDAAVSVPAPLPDDGSGVGSYDPVSRTLCVNLGRGASAESGGTINVGDYTGYQFKAQINEQGTDNFSHQAELRYRNDNDQPAVYVSQPFEVDPDLADLVIGQGVAPEAVVPGQKATLTLEVTNTGPEEWADEVVVTDTLPAEFALTNVTGSNQSSGDINCDRSATKDAVYCQFEYLDRGQTATVTITGTIAADTSAEVLTNVANVALPDSSLSYPSDPNLTNNTSTALIPVAQPSDPDVTPTSASSASSASSSANSTAVPTLTAGTGVEPAPMVATTATSADQTDVASTQPNDLTGSGPQPSDS